MSPAGGAGRDGGGGAESPERPAPEAVVLDVGEVLVDESRVWGCWARLVGVSPLTFAAVLGAAIVQGEDHTAAFAHVAPNIDWPALVDEHEDMLGGLVADDLYPDAAPCLRELTDLGVTVGVAGNQPARRRGQLERLDLDCELITTSDDLAVAKPEAGFFERIVELVGAGAPERVLYVGDRVDHDVLPGLGAGLSVCWLRRGPFGQLQALPDGVEPELVLDGLGELPVLVEQWRS